MQMLQTGSKAWSLGIDEVMRQINNSPHESLPNGITPNIVVFGRKKNAEIREPPSRRGIVMTISEDIIDRVCSTNEPDLNDPNVGAVKVALEFNVHEEEAQGSAEDEPE